MFDYEGSGREHRHQPQELQETLNREFDRSAWGKRARAIVLSPELEAWVWSGSPHVDDVAGWKNRQPSLKQWLVERKVGSRVVWSSPIGPKRHFKRPYARHASNAVRPYISRLHKRFPCADVRIDRSKNFKTFCVLGFREIGSIKNWVAPAVALIYKPGQLKKRC